MPGIVDIALKLAAKGLHVFPLRPGMKTPDCQHGCLDATRDPEQIRTLFRKADANIGLATGEKSGLIVLDFDTKGGKRGLDTHRMIDDTFGVQTLTSRTPSGGFHQFFKHRSGLKNAVERLPGVDIRTDGGYVVIPPSIVDGVRYRWTEIVPPAEMPAGLFEMLTRPTVPAYTTARTPRSYTGDRERLMQRVQKYITAVPPAIQGQGGDLHTFQLACRLVRGFGLHDHEALDVLRDWNRLCCPEWTERELIAKINGARKYGSEPIGARLEVTA